jgi:bacterioferritin-associated ferredoxin
MIVCLCRGKSDRDVRKAIDAGASSIRDLQRCGIGTDCGSCHGLLRMMLAEAAVPAAAASCPDCAASEIAAASPA